MNKPALYTADDIKNQDSYVLIKGEYFLARPRYYMGSIFYRLKLAYYVFTGKYDALKWNEIC